MTYLLNLGKCMTYLVDYGKCMTYLMVYLSYRHALIMFGGVKGMEAALEADDKLDASDPKDLFDSYLNTCPNQGSGTIRTEVIFFIE